MVVSQTIFHSLRNLPPSLSPSKYFFLLSKFTATIGQTKEQFSFDTTQDYSL